MDLGLQGKVCLVTGGASGIGESIVRHLHAEDAIPVILDRDKARGTALQMELSGSLFHALDLTQVDQVEAAVSAVLAAQGRIDAIVNNAGVNDGVGLNQAEDAFLSSLQKNLVPAYTLVRLCRVQLAAQKGGILNIGSKVAMTGQGGTSGYAAAKGGLTALTREWAVELASEGVRVNAVIPAEVWTPMYENWLNTFEDSAERRTEIESRIPLGQRMTSPEEIAAMSVFLLSGKSGHTTGQIIHVDGGYVHLDRSIRKS